MYDVFRNLGYITIGTSRDTTEFACECIRYWRHHYGRNDYPNADALLLLCDSGGSNNARYYIFKQDLQQLADELGIEIRIAHYPPYTSKYNPIEHRLFSHISRACQGVVFKNIDIVKELIESANTKTGLKVFASILDKNFATKRKYVDGFKENMRIKFDDCLPQWNYRAVPMTLPVPQVIQPLFLNIGYHSQAIQKDGKRMVLNHPQFSSFCDILAFVLHPKPGINSARIPLDCIQQEVNSFIFCSFVYRNVQFKMSHLYF